MRYTQETGTGQSWVPYDYAAPHDRDPAGFPFGARLAGKNPAWWGV
ncbi:hypothetical protein [Streptomyces sp. NPDC002215]